MGSFEIKRSLLGRYSIGYDCPNCEGRLKSPLTDAGKTDFCPACKFQFVVPGSEERERIRIQSEKEEAEEQRRESQKQEATAIQKQKAAKRKRCPGCGKRVGFWRIDLNTGEATLCFDCRLKRANERSANRQQTINVPPFGNLKVTETQQVNYHVGGETDVPNVGQQPTGSGELHRSMCPTTLENDMRIIGYRICESSGATGPKLLADQVNVLLCHGWEPIGGVTVMVSPIIGVYVYHQAMVKREQPKSAEPDTAPTPPPARKS